jgi:hypothetical protein
VCGIFNDEMITEARNDAGAWVDEQLSRCDTFGMSTIPVRREEITPEWLGAQLLGVGECVIASLDLEEMTGHNPDLSQLFRVRIDYSARTSSQPDVVIVKIPPKDEIVRLREAPYPFVGELACYRLLESFQGGSIARMYGAAEDRVEQTGCFVFEDLGDFPEGQKYAEIDLSMAKSTLEFMAEYHSKFWLDDDLGNSSWIRNADWSVILNQDPLDAATGWQVIEADDRFEKTGGLITAGEYLGEKLNDLRDAMRSRPNTLTHNDFHQGNILLRQRPTGLEPVTIDWQMPAYAGGTNDLAKFLMTAVPFDILAQRESNLVAHYVDSLVARGVRNYSFDECWRDYRRAQVATLGNYAINCFETAADGSLIESSGDSTYAVIRALTLVDPAELGEILP